MSSESRELKAQAPGVAWTVYVVRCRDRSLYAGITTDLERRLRQHNAGTASRYTRSRLPVKLVHQEPSDNRSTASKREAAIKAMTRREKLAMIRSKTKVR
jgi:predicted GIY-YIG superfamily endonuclease